MNREKVFLIMRYFLLLCAVIPLAACVSAGKITTGNISESVDREIPASLQESFKWIEYRTQRGDTISSISRQFNVSIDAVIVCNYIQNARSLKTDDMLRIPSIDGIAYTVKAEDSLLGIAESFKVPQQIIILANDVSDEAIAQRNYLFIPGAAEILDIRALSGSDQFIFPLSGRRSLNSGFGWQTDRLSGKYFFHYGIDIQAKAGEPVAAAMAGIVYEAGNDETRGNYIIINHNDNFKTLYAHLSIVSVENGNRVEKGNLIGEAGSTGYSSGPHLHFGIYYNGKAVNPVQFF